MIKRILLLLLLIPALCYGGIVEQVNMVLATHAPVLACAGYSGSTGTTSEGSTSLAFATKYVHSSGTCLIDTLEVYVDDNASTEIVLGIYSDSSGPNTLIYEITAVATPAGFAWVGGTITELQLDDGTYWLAGVANGVVSYKYVAGSAGDLRTWTVVYNGHLPATWEGSTSASRVLAYRISHS